MSENSTGKRLKIGPRPERAPTTAAEFVTGKEPTKRLTIDVAEELHRRSKAGAAREGVTIADEIRAFLERRFPN